MTTSRWQPQRRQLGNRVQAGVPLRPQPSHYERANGLLLRGVVTTTYELDNGDHPEADVNAGEDAVAIYCDVLVYSSMWQQRFQYLRAVLVSQETGGIHRGRVWKPRATSIDITNPPDGYDLDRAANPANLDGDHVLLGFMDDNLNQPVILRGIPHPAADTGNDAKPAGQRLRLKVADGDPDFQKHHGAFFGISDAGDFVVDTTQGYAGAELKANGNERAAAEDGTTGNYNVRLPKGSVVNIQIEAGASLQVENKGGDAKLTLGDGIRGVMIADNWETFWDSDFNTWVLGHTHGSGVGPTGVPINAAAFPPFATSSAKSTKSLIPDG